MCVRNAKWSYRICAAALAVVIASTVMAGSPLMKEAEAAITHVNAAPLADERKPDADGTKKMAAASEEQEAQKMQDAQEAQEAQEGQDAQEGQKAQKGQDTQEGQEAQEGQDTQEGQEAQEADHVVDTEEEAARVGQLAGTILSLLIYVLFGAFIIRSLHRRK